MKKNILLSVIFVLAGLFASQSGKAQQIDLNTGQVVWTGTTLEDAVASCANGGYVYFLQFKETLDASSPEKYISSGGDFGVQGVLSSVGMRMQIFKSTERGKTDYYQVVTRVDNKGGAATQGDRMGFNGHDNNRYVHLDRGATSSTSSSARNYVNWQFYKGTSTKRNIRFRVQTGVDDTGKPIYTNETTAHTVEVTTYTLVNRDENDNNNSYWVGINDNGLVVKQAGNNVTSNNNATKWVIVSEEDYSKAMQDVTWGEVDLGVFAQDAEFGRDNKDYTYWQWGTWDGTTWNKLDNQEDSWTLTGTPHWHQRNQNLMCNGVNLPDDNTVIAYGKVGNNVTGSSSLQYGISRETLRAKYGQYYKAEIYNEAIALSQTLSGSNIPNLTDGLYKLTAQALYHDGESGTTNNGVSYFVVKRVEYQYQVDDDGKMMKDEDGNPIFIYEADGETKKVKDISIQRLPVRAINSVSNEITAQSGISAGKEMNDHHDKYVLTFFVEISGAADITIGIEQQQAIGWTVIGNVHLYANGKQALFIDEDWCEKTSVPYIENGETVWSQGDPYEHTQFNGKYEYPATVYYNRTFAKETGKFNPICLPIDMTGYQVRQAFGNDCMLSELEKVTDGAWKVIVFKPVDLDALSDVTALHKGRPYIVKVTTAPFVPAGEKHTMEVGNGGQNHTVTIDGPIYALPGITKDEASGLPEIVPVTKDGITFEGTFYFKAIPVETITGGSEDYWQFRQGGLYHLDGEHPIKIWKWDETAGESGHGANVKTADEGYMIWGTYAYLHAPKDATGNAKNVTFGIEDEFGEITAIDIEGMEVPQSQAIEDNSVYTMNGQKIGGQGNLNSLKKGIYIVNGRKFVVK